MIDDFDLTCIEMVRKNFTKSEELLEGCDCPYECEFSGFHDKISYAEYPTRYYFENFLRNSSLIQSKFKSNLTFENVKAKIAKVSIYFGDMKETVVGQEVKTEPGDMVSNIGGILGLFLGE